MGPGLLATNIVLRCGFFFNPFNSSATKVLGGTEIECCASAMAVSSSTRRCRSVFGLAEHFGHSSVDGSKYHLKEIRYTAPPQTVPPRAMVAQSNQETGVLLVNDHCVDIAPDVRGRRSREVVTLSRITTDWGWPAVCVGTGYAAHHASGVVIFRGQLLRVTPAHETPSKNVLTM